MITILTTIFNDYSIIDRLLNSLLQQKSNDFVHIIYDDGSTNIDKKKIDAYINYAKKNRNYNVAFIQGTNNIGVNKAHEALFKMVKTDYFTWIDADDWVSVNFITTINKLINKHRDVDVFHINSHKYSPSLKRSNKSTLYKRSNTLKKKDQFVNFCLDDDKFFHHFVIKTKTFRDINPQQIIFDPKHADPFWYDAQLLFEMAVCHSKFYMVKKPLSFILDRETSVSRSTMSEKDYNEHEYIPLIFKYCKISDENKLLFYTLLPYSKEQKKAYNLVLSNNLTEAKTLINKNNQFLKENKISKSYKVLHKNIRLLLFHKKYEVLFKIRKAVLSLFKNNYQ